MPRVPRRAGVLYAGELPMAARMIVTSHPDVECDVCGRRLLRGERPDVFLGGGQRRMVCELCSSRATHEGWRRETAGSETPGSRATSPTRGRSLLERLRSRREPVHDPTRTAAPPTTPPSPERRRVRASRRGEAEWAQIDEEWSGTEPEWNGAQGSTETVEPNRAAEHSTPGDPDVQTSWPASVQDPSPASPSVAGDATAPNPADLSAAPKPADLLPPTEAMPVAEIPGAARVRETAQADMRRGLDVFNAGDGPQRIAGVARALGPASVQVSARAEGVVAIVVAWELCWYRYEVDLSDEAAGARIAAEGTELDELAPEERLANAAADERGCLALAAD